MRRSIATNSIETTLVRVEDILNSRPPNQITENVEEPSSLVIGRRLWSLPPPPPTRKKISRASANVNHSKLSRRKTRYMDTVLQHWNRTGKAGARTASQNNYNTI